MNPPLYRGALCVLFVASTLSTTVLSVDTYAASPIVASYDRLEGKKRVQRFHAGRLLMEELNCVACHDAGDQILSPKTAPVLTEVSGRAKANHLRKFIADPQATKPGTTMPSLFHSMSAADRDAQVEALVHFLYSIGPGEPPQAYARFGAGKRGKELFHTLGCVGCHNPEGKELKGSVPHGDLEDKYTLASLSAFLLNPHKARPAGRMPSLNLTSNEASDIASYLLPKTPEKAGIEFAHYKTELDRLPDFSKLQPTKTGLATEFDVGKHGSGDRFALRYMGELDIVKSDTYRFQLGSDDGSKLLIDDKVVVNNDGVHGMNRKRGKVKLEAGRHAIVVEYFERDGGEELEVLFSGPGFERERLDLAMVATAPEEPLEDLAFKVDTTLAAKGKKLFASLGCASCHEAGEAIKSEMKAPAIAKLDAAKGCLADDVSAGVRYDLSSSQKTALRKVAQDGIPKLQPKRLVQHTMLQFNCVACHARQKLGGVDVDRTEYFTTTQQEMGMEGSIPPHLDGVGAKLTRVWLDQILAEGAKDRPYMLTRMPKFGTDNVGHLGATLERLDQTKPLKKLDIDPLVAKKAGHKMVGAKGFSCIKCHTFGRYKATGVQSIDMTIMSKRLREDWFREYAMNPQAYRPGTRMPSAWPPSGPSLLPELLDADSEKQIAAIWRYLQDGIRAKTPFGLSTNSKELIPTEEAIIYRNFIQGAGSRAIGVGYPEGVHLAFDANDARLALIWQGAFIDASRHWNGRGQGYQPPAGEKVQSLVAGISIATLPNPDAAWPNAAARTAPDGSPMGKSLPPSSSHKFGGYRLSVDQRPTFLYEVQGLNVEDFPNPVETATEVYLNRKLTISGSPKSNTFMRLAAGKVSRSGDSFRLNDALQLKIENAGDLNVTIREADGAQELLVPLTKPLTEIELEYTW